MTTASSSGSAPASSPPSPCSKFRQGPDADLTPLGKTQAKVAATAWTRELADGAPFPDLFLSSPMTRAADTLRITWMDQGKEVRPVIRELWRETIGASTLLL